MNYKFQSMFVIFVLLLSGCEKPEIKELKRLCALDAGMKVYETVQADGYFDATENGALVADSLATLQPISISGDTTYQYIEFCKDIPSGSYDVGVKLDKGCWHAEKVLRSSGYCNADADAMIKKYVVPPYVEFIKDHCIIFDKIDKPMAQFKFERKSKEWIDEKSKFKFMQGHAIITDTNANKVVAENIGYLAVKGDVSYSCGSPKITGLSKNTPYEKSLISNTIMRKIIK